jgi:hypothetical protein
MSQISSPYQIAGSLNFMPGGNPIMGMAEGLPGLAMSYQQDYDSALQGNQQNYNNILAGYQQNYGQLQTGLSAVGAGYGSLMSGITNTLGADYGVPGASNQWGIAAPAAAAINKEFAAQTGQRFDANGNPIGVPTGGSIANSLISQGLGNTSAMPDDSRSATQDYNTALGSLGANLAQTYAGYQSSIGQAYLGQQNSENMALANQGNQQLAFQNSVQIPYPSASAYAAIAQQQGQAAQAAAAQAQQLQIFKMGLGRGGASGGGASVGAAPRGGTYGSGGGGFASGGGVEPTGPTSSNSSNPYWNNAPAGGGGGNAGSLGLFNNNPTAAYDPWSTPTGTASGDPTGMGELDPNDVTGNFGNAGYYLGSGVA